ncbi:FAD-binding domain-containing protein [Thozetella sp. PMI_491]|nr:FAD-binding domain-containing protein [Thozetella sp. PMI_491]
MSRLSTAWLLCLPALCLCQTLDAWAQLNTSLGGRLYRTQPLALPCFALYNGNPVAIDAAACNQLRQNYTSNSFRVNIPGGYMNLEDEMCFSDPEDQCLLDNTVTPAAAPASGSSCNQGSVPSYHIAIEDAADAKAVFVFAKAHKVPVAIKNSGHDYLSRNSQKGAISLWVHKLQDLSYHQAFVPDGCSDTESVGPAVTVGGGASTQSVLEFASKNKAIFVTGYSPTIAVSGGWVQGGGHSVLAPAFGLGVDRVVEFHIVTPDGALRTANKCQHRDLFWALRGGGGGTFGVVLAATHRVEPAVPVAIASITLPSNATSDTALNWIRLVAQQSVQWAKEGWGGHVGGTYLTYMNPVIADADAAKASMQPATEFAIQIGGTSTVEVLPDYLDVWDKYVLPGARSTAGQMRFLASRLIPTRLFEDDDGVSKIMDFVTALQKIGYDPLRFYAPVGSPYALSANTSAQSTNGTRPCGTYGTSVTPAWYSSLWTIGSGLSVAWNASYTDRLRAITQLQEATQLGEELTGQDGGTYVNEANPFTTDWRESWWGPNYEPLLKVKQKFDPDAVLNCWKCVGFEDADIASDRFRCFGKVQNDVDAS